MLDSLLEKITHKRFLSLRPSYEEIISVLPNSLKVEYIKFARLIENLPQFYSGNGDFGIDGPLSDNDQDIRNRYSEIFIVGEKKLKEQGWKPLDPTTGKLSGRVLLNILRLVGNSLKDFDVYKN